MSVKLHAPSGRNSTASSSSGNPLTRQNTMSSYDGSRSTRQSKRYSMSALYMSMSANEGDLQIEDELAKAQKVLRELKSKISSQSKKNFVLEKDVRYLDSRIALLIQNRMALEEQHEVASHLEDATDMQEGFFPNDDKTQKYGNLLFLLQSEPRHIAHLCRLVSMAEIDSLLQTVMFTIYGNQYESREEHLLLTMFQSVLTYQFEHTPDYSSLLRANTPVSRMMTTYTRRGPGQSFLKSVLAERIDSLIQLKDLDLEINPLKVYERMVEQIEEDTGKPPPDLPKGITGEQAAENPQVQAIIEPRLTMLTEIANGFLNTIIEGLEEAPYGIRWICKQIRSLTKRKYPDANDQVVCTLIGGFFFLRFINPAIVTPKSYMLIDGVPAERPRRTLTYIAKMIQNLANKPSYAKEPYMAKLQPFIQANKDRINKFMLDLCEVQDFYESLEMDNYVALSKKDLQLDITLNEIYAMHALIEKHHSELCRDENSHLSIIVSELGQAPAQVPRKENKVINLPLFSRWETAITDLTSALDITQEEVYFMEAKSVFVQIMRSIPSSSQVARRPLRLERVADAAATSRNDAVMVRKGIRAMELLSQLQELGVIDKSDHFSLLRDEVEQELQHLGSLKEGVIVETQKLNEVYKTIRDHNTYLNGQLETYKSYLHNVRSQSEGTKRKQQKQQVLGPYKFRPSLPKQPSVDTAKPEPPLPSSLTSQSAWPNTPKTKPIPAQAKWPMPPTGPPTLAQGNWPEPPKGGPSLAQENWPEPPKHGRIPSQSANEIVKESPEKKVNQAPPRLSLAKSGSGFFDLSSDWLEQHKAAPTQLETVEEPAIDDFQSPPYPPTKNPAKELVEEPGKTAIQEPSMKVIGQPAKEPIKGPTNELKEGNQNINKEASQDSQGNGQKSRPTGYRPPTPEYQKEDVKTPIVDSFASPLSPASSPEPPNNESAQDLPKAQSENQPTVMKKDQLVSEVKVETQPPPMKPTPGDPILKAPQPVSAPAPTTPRRLSLDMRSRAGTPPLTEPFPSYAAMSFSGRNSPGLSGRNSPGPDGPRGRQPEGYFRPGSRNASVRPESRSGSAHPDSRRRLDSMRSTAPEPDRFVRSSSGELLYRGRDGTLYPEMKELREPDPKAAYFPLQNSEPVAEGTVFQAVPLRNTHYRCYQSHKSMLRRNNKLYPLACQTCQKSDTEDRWACTFCSLRICESCMGVLDSNKKDLASLMHSLAGQTPSAS